MLADWFDMAAMPLNHRRSPAGLAGYRDARLRRLVRHAYHTTPYYRRLIEAAGLTPGAFRGVDDLARLPVTDKHTLQTLPVEDRLSTTFALTELRRDRTSGSTGRPFDIWHDKGFSRRRQLSFLRSLMVGGYCWPMRLLLVSGAPGRTAPAVCNWRYVHGEIEPEALRETIRAWRPHALYGFTTPLRQLASLIDRDGGEIPRTRMIFTTAEGVDRSTRDLLQRRVGDDVFELYGTTEMGPIAWECRGHEGLHVSEDTAVTELVDSDPASGVARLVVTGLDLYAMPLIRYAVGDFAIAGPSEPCSCGSRFPRLAHIAGRLVDCVTLPDGRELSPYQLTESIEDVRGLLRYQIVQEAIDRFRVRAQTAPGSEGVESGIVQGLRPLLGHTAEIVVEGVADLEPPRGQKFRVVVNHLR